MPMLNETTEASGTEGRIPLLSVGWRSPACVSQRGRQTLFILI